MGPIPTSGQSPSESEETLKAESETADLWQPEWNENHTVLAAAIHTLDRMQVPERCSGWELKLGTVEH